MMYRFCAIRLTISAVFFCRNGHLITKFVWKCRVFSIVKIVLKENKARRLLLPHYKSVPKLRWYRWCCTGVRTDVLISGIECINYDQLISTSVWRQLEYLHILFKINAAGATGYLHAKDRSWSSPNTIHKNEAKKKKKISRKSKSFVNFGLGDDFLCKVSKAQETKGKKKNLHALKGTIKQVKSLTLTQPTE